MALTANAVEVLEARYLERNEKGEITETPEGCFMRSAECVSSVEQHQKQWQNRFYNMMMNGDFMPNSPTIMNAGKENGQLSACFVLPIEDSMDGIFTTLKHTALIHKTGGGTGFPFSSLRPEGSMVSSKAGVSTGPLAFCQVYDKATEVIKQGSSRRGANMMVFRVDHPDILQFIDMKMTPGVMVNFNVSVAITDTFMNALELDTEYELWHPFTGVTGKLRARDVWDRIAHNAWRSAEPGLLFIDRANRKSVYEEELEATNPCGEQWLPPYGSCNLGSINVSNFVEDGALDWPRLQRAIRDSVRFLDNVIDVNCYPLPEIHKTAHYYRNIGLGPMGWADALIKLGIPYNSNKAISFAFDFMRDFNQVAHRASFELAKEKGLPLGAPFKSFFNYSYALRRNATLTNCAPTGTISFFAGCSSGIEPNFAFVWESFQADKVLDWCHPLYEKARNNGGVKKEVFVTAHDVSPEYHVSMQAAFQANVDNAISKTINLPESCSIKDVKNAYQQAWNQGCKGITVYRDGSREGVLHRKDDPKTVEKEYCEDCGTELIQESGCATCPACHMSKCAVA